MRFSALGSTVLPRNSVYGQIDSGSVNAQFDRVLDALEEKLPKVAAHLEAARADVLAFVDSERTLAAGTDAITEEDDTDLALSA